MAEYRARLDRVNALVREAGLDAFLATSKDSVYYLTGFKYEPFERPFFLIFRGKGAPDVVVPRIEAENMSLVQNLGEQYEYIDFPALPGGGWLDELCRHLPRGGSVGVEPSLPAELFVQLKDYSPQVAPIVERARRVKSAQEIAQIELTSHFSDLGMRMLFEVSKPGARAKEGYRRIDDLKKAVIDKVGYLDQYVSSMWVGVWVAPHSAKPHRFPEPDDVLGDGPNVGLVFIRVNGYSAETERTYFVGKPTAREREAFQAMSRAREIAFEMLRPGARAHDIDHGVMSFLRAEGLSENLLHRTGHGIGLEAHEPPYIVAGDRTKLEAGMTFSIEPGIYLPDRFGVRIEDIVAVTGDGARRLNEAPREPLSVR